MTINPNNTTAACSGSEPSVDLMQRVWANLYFNEADAGNTFQETLNEVVDWLAARGALPDHDKPYTTQASAPRSASAGGDQAHYLSAIRRRLEQLYDASPDNPRLREQLSDELDWVDVQIEEGKLSAPPAIRIDQDAGIRTLDWLETFTDRGDGSKDQTGWEADNGFGSWYSVEQYFGSDSYWWEVKFDSDVIANRDDPDQAKQAAQSDFETRIRAAISVNTTAVREAPESCPHCFDRTDCSNVDICKAVEEVYREPANATAGATSLGISEDTAQLALDVHARRASPKVGPVGSDDDIRFLALSMAGEAGEAANVVKKAWRDGTPLNRPALAEEIAGTACYLIGISAAIKTNLNAEMREQMAQFELRYASNPLEGKDSK